MASVTGTSPSGATSTITVTRSWPYPDNPGYVNPILRLNYVAGDHTGHVQATVDGLFITPAGAQSFTAIHHSGTDSGTNTYQYEFQVSPYSSAVAGAVLSAFRVTFVDEAGTSTVGWLYADGYTAPPADVPDGTPPPGGTPPILTGQTLKITATTSGLDPEGPAVWFGAKAPVTGLNSNNSAATGALLGGYEYIASAYVYCEADVRLRIDGEDLGEADSALGEADLGMGWKRIWLRFFAPRTDPDLEIIMDLAHAPGQTAEAYIENIMIEDAGEHTAPTEYFDGSMGMDYLWRNGGKPGNSPSFHYPNRLGTTGLVRKLVQDNLPIDTVVDTDFDYGYLPIR